MNPIDLISECARQLSQAKHGEKGAIYQHFEDETGMNKQKIMKAIKTYKLRPARKVRADAGSSALSFQEASDIVRWQRENMRQNGKRMVKLEAAVETLRANGIIKADYFDADTGEVFQLTISAIRNAIASYGLSAKTLDARAFVVEIKYEHPNHVWEIDASVCTLYYLPKTGGLTEMLPVEFEKNKPANYKRVEKARVTRYAVVDCASHCIYVEYFFGGESAANLTEVLINAMQRRPGEALCGVPRIIYTDPGSAHTGSVYNNLCKRMQIEAICHLPGKANATGAVEKAHDLIETEFETTLKSKAVESLDELNERARTWRVRYNATAVHTRHNMPRAHAWLTIKTAQLIEAPDVETCKLLAQTREKIVTVSPYQTVKYAGNEFDVSEYREELSLYSGQKLTVAQNAFHKDQINIIVGEQDGVDQILIAPMVVRGELGYREDAGVFGEDTKSAGRSQGQKTLEAFEEISAAEQPPGKRKQRIPFGGRVDPDKHWDDQSIPEMLPRTAGSERSVGAVFQEQPMSYIEAAKRLRTHPAFNYTPDTLSQLKKRFPDGGVTEDQLDQFVRAPRSLSAVEGGAQ